MALIDDIRDQLRITSVDFDDEINSLIATCKKDLEIAGIYNVDESDPMIINAATLYCKANFGYDNPEAERFMMTYENIKEKISLASEYSRYKVTILAGEQCRVTFDGETKETDSSGEVIFYIREKNHVPFSIAGGETQYQDIDGDTVINASG